MFRYIALAWPEADATRTAVARHLGQQVRAMPGWQCHLSQPGLMILATGAGGRAHSVCELPGQRGAVIGRLFRRSDHDAAPGLPARPSPAEAGRIVRTQGRGLVRDWWGRYVALLPAPTGGMLVLRDPSGALPCYRTRHHGVGIAFSWLEDLLQAWPDLPPPEVAWDDLAAQLLQGRLCGVRTALQHIDQVPAGTLLSLEDSAAPVALPWDAAAFAREAIDAEPARAAQRLRHTVRACARAWAGCHDGILLRLSGGVDSAILLSCLDGLSPASGITCLNFHAPGADGDERAYARLAAGQAGRPLVERECDIRFPLASVLNVALTPAPENYMGRLSMGRIDAELAHALEARALFTGGGGDQLFFELRCTWPGADYLSVRGVDGGLPCAVADAARLGRVSVWQAAWRTVADGLRTRWPEAVPGRHLRLVGEALRDAPADPSRHAHPAFAGPTGLPIGKFHQAVELMAPAPFYDPYLRDTSPEIVNPLMSQPVLELCLGLPTYLLTRGGRGRALARQAFASDIPPAIANRRSKGGLEEHLTALLQRNLVLARSILLDGELVRHGLLDRRRLQAALDGRASVDDAHVGEIHNCIAVEAWLQRAASWSRARAAQGGAPPA